MKSINVAARRPTAALPFLGLLLLSLSVQTARAEFITAHVTATNTAVTGNRIYVATSSGSQLLTWTNQNSPTLLLTNLASPAGTLTNVVRHFGNYPLLGLFISQTNLTNLTFRGSDLVVTQLGTWASIVLTTNQSTNGTYSHTFPYDALTPATRTNNASEDWYGLFKYSTNRAMSNVTIRAAALENVTVSNALYLGRLDFLAGLGLHGLSGIQTNYTITTNDLYVGVDTHTNTVTLTLPSAASSSNLFWWIKDEWGAAATNILTIYPAAGNRIDGLTNLVVSNNFGSVSLRSRGGTNFSVMNAGAGVSGSSPGSGGSSVLTSNVVWVSKSGDDGTGERGNASKPFLTPFAAKTAAAAGDTIFVLPGTYNDSDFLKNGVHWHFFLGSHIIQTTGRSGDPSIFDDTYGSDAGSITSNITGDGWFTCLYAPAAEVVELTDSASVIRLHARRLDASSVGIVDGGADLQITGAEIIGTNTSNVAVTYGGPLLLQQCLISNTNCTAQHGSALEAFGDGIVLRDCVLLGNTNATAPRAIQSDGSAHTLKIYGSLMANLTNDVNISFLTGSNRHEISPSVQ